MQTGSNRIVIDEIPLEGQQEAWRSALNSIGIEPCLPLGNSVPSGDFLLRSLPTGARMSLLRSSAQLLRRKDGAEKVSDKLLVMFFSTSKPIGFRYNNSTQTIIDDQILIADFRSPWKVDIASEFELFILEVSCERLFGRIGARKISLPVTLVASPIHNLAAVLIRSVSEKFYSLQQFELASAESAVIELLVDGLLSHRTKELQQSTQTQAGHLHRVHAVIEAHLGDPELSIGKVSAHEGLSTRYIQRLFERQNITFSTYLRKRRLERCRLDLIDPKQNSSSISEIGFRWGFRDQATFSRAFSLEYGMSPRELRKSIAASDQRLLTRGRPYLRPVSDGSLWHGVTELASSKALVDRREAGRGSKPHLTTQARYHLPGHQTGVPAHPLTGPIQRITLAPALSQAPETSCCKAFRRRPECRNLQICR